LIVNRSTTRGFTLPRAAALVTGLGVAAGLAVAAPVHAASPSTAASRIVAARHHKEPDGRQMRHRTSPRPAERHSGR
jgi:hypothetical protein